MPLSQMLHVLLSLEWNRSFLAINILVKQKAHKSKIGRKRSHIWACRLPTTRFEPPRVDVDWKPPFVLILPRLYPQLHIEWHLHDQTSRPFPIALTQGWLLTLLIKHQCQSTENKRRRRRKSVSWSRETCTSLLTQERSTTASTTCAPSDFLATRPSGASWWIGPETTSKITQKT